MIPIKNVLSNSENVYHYGSDEQFKSRQRQYCSIECFSVPWMINWKINRMNNVFYLYQVYK